MCPVNIGKSWLYDSLRYFRSVAVFHTRLVNKNRKELVYERQLLTTDWLLSGFWVVFGSQFKNASAKVIIGKTVDCSSVVNECFTRLPLKVTTHSVKVMQELQTFQCWFLKQPSSVKQILLLLEALRFVRCIIRGDGTEFMKQTKEARCRLTTCMVDWLGDITGDHSSL